MLNMLSAAGPDQFEAMYVRMMVVSHNEAVLVHTAYAAGRKKPALKAGAGKRSDRHGAPPAGARLGESLPALR